MGLSYTLKYVSSNKFESHCSRSNGGSPKKDMSMSYSLEPMNFTLFGTRVFADIIKVRISR